MRDHRTDLGLIRQAADAARPAHHGQAEPAGPAPSIQARSRKEAGQ